ncbi:hypothetical protein FHS29_002971 [Saccharothrix tamanrassetensis]|uniref:Uncharacterized protein n=1 Tax=Saccharothrix tamanrassetensis TaxID=1051531 RepID=A0A841CK62_9PSEU|nr:hypothetical protein [Saccharothrix tamanrassetensis]MBB5956385.1 hypothetical protein [Saccharothrix tamanrassetensis]
MPTAARLPSTLLLGTGVLLTGAGTRPRARLRLLRLRLRLRLVLGHVHHSGVYA